MIELFIIYILIGVLTYGQAMSEIGEQYIGVLGINKGDILLSLSMSLMGPIGLASIVSVRISREGRLWRKPCWKFTIEPPTINSDLYLSEWKQVNFGRK